MRKTLEAIFSFLLMAAIGVAMAFFVVEWMAGCGEHYIDSKGKTHQNECVFLNK